MKKTFFVILIIIFLLLVACNNKFTDTHDNYLVSDNNFVDEKTNINDDTFSQVPIAITEVKREFLIYEYTPHNDFDICFSQESSISENTIIYKYQFYDGEIKYGFMDLEFNILTDLISDYPCRFNNGLVKIINGFEEYILDNQFRIIEYNEDKPILYNGIWHKEIYTPDEFIIDGKAVPFYKYNNGIYNTDLNEYLVPYMSLTNPETGESFSSPKWGYTTFYNAYVSSENLQYVIPPIFDYAREFSDGLAVVKKDGKYGYINKNGETVIDYQYYLAEDFYDGIAEVGEATMKGDGSGQIKRALINKSGEMLTDFKFISIGDFYEGYAIASTDRKSKVIISNNGTEMFSAQVPYISNFQNGYAVVMAEPHVTYIVDYWGQRINNDNYTHILGYREDLCAVATENGWNYINRYGEYLSDERYLYAGNFSNGVALVTEMRGGASYLIDLVGNKYLQELNLRNISSFTDEGYALAYSEIVEDERAQRKYYIIRMSVTNKIDK